MRKHDLMALYLYLEIKRLREENEKLRAADDQQNRCPVMLPNRYGKERCGQRRGHEGNCCYQRGD